MTPTGATQEARDRALLLLSEVIPGAILTDVKKFFDEAIAAAREEGQTLGRIAASAAPHSAMIVQPPPMTFHVKAERNSKGWNYEGAVKDGKTIEETLRALSALTTALEAQYGRKSDE